MLLFTTSFIVNFGHEIHQLSKTMAKTKSVQAWKKASQVLP